MLGIKYIVHTMYHIEPYGIYHVLYRAVQYISYTIQKYTVHTMYHLDLYGICLVPYRALLNTRSNVMTLQTAFSYLIIMGVATV